MKINTWSKPMIISGVLKQFSKTNNGRVYPSDILEKEIERYQAEQNRKKREEILEGLLSKESVNF